MVENTRGSSTGSTGGTGTTVQSPQAVTDYIQEASRNRQQFMSLFRQICAQARQAGVSEQEILTNIPEWYHSGGAGSGSSR